MGEDSPLDLARQHGAPPEAVAALEVAAAEVSPEEERSPSQTRRRGSSSPTTAQRRGSSSLALARARAVSISRRASAVASVGRQSIEQHIHLPHNRTSSLPAVERKSTKMGAKLGLGRGLGLGLGLAYA